VKRVIAVKTEADWKLDVTFSDGTRGIISMKDRLFGPVFEPLKDPTLFSQAAVDEFGAVYWPNGADLAPDALYEKLKTTSRVA
jgi:tRNA U34 5-methylaminomethyl-2-thiouridine-forming methyltransferase MnmC